MKGKEIINKTKFKRVINISLQGKLYKAYKEKLCFSIVENTCLIL